MPPSPTFENISLNTLNSEQKPSVKKPVDRAGQPVFLHRQKRSSEAVVVRNGWQKRSEERDLCLGPAPGALRNVNPARK